MERVLTYSEEDALDYRSLFESTPDPFLVLSPDFIILDATDAYLEATMTRRSEIVGRHILDVFPDNPDDRRASGVKKLRTSLERVLRERVPDTMTIQKYDIRRPHRRGGEFEERYWSSTNSPVLDDDGEVTAIVHRAVDVTDFVNAKEAEKSGRTPAAGFRARIKQSEAEILQNARSLERSNNRLRAANERLKFASDEARIARERISSILETISEGFVSLDKHWCIVYINAESERLNRVRREEVVGRTLWDIYPELRQTQAESELQRAMHDKVAVSFEEYWSPADRWFSVRAYPSPEGGLTVHYRDVTRNVRAKADAERLRKREEKYIAKLQALAHGSIAIASASDIQNTLSQIARQARAIIGAHEGYVTLVDYPSVENPLSVSSLSEQHANKRASARQFKRSATWNQVLQGSRVVRLSRSELAKNPLWGDAGESTAVPLKGWMAAPLTGPRGRKLGLIELTEKYEGDFTEEDDSVLVQLAQLASASIARAEAEAAMRESEWRFRGTFQNAAVGMGHVSLDGRWLNVNNRLSEQLGYSVEELLALHLKDVADPENVPSIRRAIDSLLWANSDHFSRDERFRKKDGDMLPVRLTISVQRHDRTGVPQYLIVIVEDISDRKRATDALIESEERLRSLNETLEERVKERTTELIRYQNRLRSLASELSRTEARERQNIAADLHDHLAQSLIIAKLRLATFAKTASEEESAFVADLATVLNDALTYTRGLMADLSPAVLQHQNDVIMALKWLAEKMAENGLDVSVESDPNSISLEKDTLAALFRSIRELLLNVVKHAGTNQAFLGIRRVKNHLHILVEDKGAGFVAPKSGLARSVESGFGLFSIHERIDLMGGKMKISSSPGKGTSIEIRVPIGQETRDDDYASDRRGDTPQRHRKSGHAIRVVLVDDHNVMRAGLRSVIDGEADMVVVGEAADGEAAVRVVDMVRPDVVIMDVNMPLMNGIMATSRIVAEIPNVTVIGLSLHEDDGVSTAMINAGASGYVTKGDAYETLCETIRSLVAVRQNVV